MDKKTELINEIQELGYEPSVINYKDSNEFKKNNYSSRSWKLPEENYRLRGTPFYHSSETDFIHFTSIEALYSILNSGYIRLYNLFNMDDKFELEYARKELLFKTSKDIDKEQLFCFSMCSSNEILKKNELKEHLLWNLHGLKGNGVIIRIRILNDLDSWYNFHLTKMFYDLKNFQTIKRLNRLTENEFLDAKLACFVKLPIYKFEDEIRLVFDNRNPVTVKDWQDNILYPKVYSDKLDKPAKIMYFQIPIYNFFKGDNTIFLAPNMQSQQYEIPKMEIIEIILGYHYSETDLINIKDKIDHKLSDINIRLTNLKRFY